MKANTHAEHRLGSLRDVWINSREQGTQAKTACGRWVDLWDDPEKKRWVFDERPSCPKCRMALAVEKEEAQPYEPITDER